MKKVEISKAEASRNGFLMFYYRLGEEIDIARTAQDYLILAEQCAKFAACCGKVAVFDRRFQEAGEGRAKRNGRPAMFDVLEHEQLDRVKVEEVEEETAQLVFDLVGKVGGFLACRGRRRAL